MSRHAYGYGSGTLTIAELESRDGHRMHPEYRRRLFAWLGAQSNGMGIGEGWRRTPSNTSAASRAGHSFHQTQRFASGFSGIAAVDLVVPVRGSAHRAPTWAEVPKQGSAEARKWGLHANVPGEPWHLQPVELDGWRTWSRHGRPDPKAGYEIPGSGWHPVTDPAPDLPPFNPARGLFSLWPFGKKPNLEKGDRGDAVRYAQGVILHHAGGDILVDGDFGSATKRRVKDLQRFFGLTVDGKIGPRTWAVIDMLSGR